MLRVWIFSALFALSFELVGCATEDPMIEQIARDTLSAENLDQHDFISLSNGRIAYVWWYA